MYVKWVCFPLNYRYWDKIVFYFSSSVKNIAGEISNWYKSKQNLFLVICYILSQRIKHQHRRLVQPVTNPSSRSSLSRKTKKWSTGQNLVKSGNSSKMADSDWLNPVYFFPPMSTRCGFTIQLVPSRFVDQCRLTELC